MKWTRGAPHGTHHQRKPHGNMARQLHRCEDNKGYPNSSHYQTDGHTAGVIQLTMGC